MKPSEVLSISRVEPDRTWLGPDRSWGGSWQEVGKIQQKASGTYNEWMEICGKEMEPGRKWNRRHIEMEWNAFTEQDELWPEVGPRLATGGKSDRKWDGA